MGFQPAAQGDFVISRDMSYSRSYYFQGHGLYLLPDQLTDPITGTTSVREDKRVIYGTILRLGSFCNHNHKIRTACSYYICFLTAFFCPGSSASFRFGFRRCPGRCFGLCKSAAICRLQSSQDGFCLPEHGHVAVLVFFGKLHIGGIY